MKKPNLKALKISVMIFMFGISFAASAVQVAETTITISSIRTSDNTGNVYIYPAEQVEQLNATCESSQGYAIDKNYELFNQMYSSLLTAATAGKKVKIWVPLEANDCINQYQKIKVVEVLF